MKEAKELLEKIEEAGGRGSYRYSNNKNYIWNKAIALYARHNPTANVRKGCSSCAKSAYGWLTNKAKEIQEEISDELKAEYKEKTGIKRVNANITKAEMLKAIASEEDN